MVIELSEELEAALKVRAVVNGVAPEEYAREILVKGVAPTAGEGVLKPLKSCYGILAKYGPGPSAEDIDENRKDMFQTWGEDF